MEQAQSVDAIVQAAIRTLGVERADILPTHDLQIDLGVDSTELVELAALLRTQLGLHAQRINLAGVITVNDLIEQVKALLGKATRAAEA